MAFGDCLTNAEGWHDPNEFPVKDARAFLTKIKGQ